MSEATTSLTGMPARYATALFELAIEDKALEKVGKELVQIEAMLDTSEDLQRLITSPAFTAEQQERSISAILEKAKIKGITANFLALVAQKRRLFALPKMIQCYRGLLSRHKGEVRAEVTSAAKLSADQQKKLKSSLKSVVGRDIQVDTVIDESLLGGLIVKVGSQMIDTSLRTKLQNLKIAMKEVG